MAPKTDKETATWRSIAFDLTGLTLAFSAAWFVVNPTGEFPLNDDWVYAEIVRGMAEDGVFRPIAFFSASFVSQALWGVAFVKAFGFSFLTLRLSTFALALLGIAGTYLLTRELVQVRGYAILAALTLAFNPIYFGLSHTFMTDVPFSAFTAIALFFLVRNLRHKRIADLIAGSCCTTLAILCRQIGLFIPIAFGVTCLIRSKPSVATLARASFPGLMGLGSLLAYRLLIDTPSSLTVFERALSFLGPDLSVAEPSLSVFFQFALLLILTGFVRLVFMLLYLGLFLLPILILTTTPKPAESWNIPHGIRHVAGIAFLLTVAIASGNLFPWLSNIIVDGGMGPLTLRDSHILELPSGMEIGIWLWGSLTVLALVGCGLLVSRLKSAATTVLALRNPDGGLTGVSDGVLFCVFSVLVYTLPILLVGTVFDRYLVPIVIPAVGIIAALRRPPASDGRRLYYGAAVFLLAGAGFFSIGATHDYLTWNRARWTALEELAGDGILPTEIDGGFEFNGSYLYSDDYERVDGQSWWWVENDRYVLAFGQLPGYTIHRQYAFTRWIPPRSGTVLVLRREAN